MNVKKVLIISENEISEKITNVLKNENISTKINFILSKDNLVIQLICKDINKKKNTLEKDLVISDEGNEMLEIDVFKTILKLFNICNLKEFEKCFKKGTNYYFQISE